MVMKFHFKLISETQNKGSLPQSCQSTSSTHQISPGHSEGWYRGKFPSLQAMIKSQKALRALAEQA